MRISDWSSDVCSSDLTVAQYVPSVALSIRQTVSVALFRSIVARVLLLRRMPFPRRSAIRPALCIIFEAELRQMQRAEGFMRAAILAAREIGSVGRRSEEHTSELQSLMRSSYAVFCLKKKKQPI